MRRTFSEHDLRKVECLDGLWTLRPHDDTEAVYQAYVPGVWERIPALAAFRGTADYERTVSIRQAGSYLLRMGAVSHTGHVTWDGQLVGQHTNAYTGFDILLPDVSAGVHQLRVTVDNNFGETSALHMPNDYFTYGGINRTVELHRVNKVYLERMAFHSVKIGEGRFIAHVKAYVHVIQAVDSLELTITVAGASAGAVLFSLRPGETREVAFSLAVQDVRCWDVLQPSLYELKAELIAENGPVDDLIDHVGFRTVEIKGERILLNGREVFIKGFNRHEDHGLFGCALPLEAMADDLQRVVDMGANAIRTCHYPNDPRFLDLCDEMGLLVWEEHHARGLSIDVISKPQFDAQESACNEEMVAQHVNHPCIYVWGVLNECESATEEGRAIYAKHLNHLRQLDPTRPVSFASCRFKSDICMDLVDIASFNMYPKWYHNTPVSQYIQELLTWMDAAGAAGKPILITEVGAGGVAGFHDPLGRAKWSEERQCDILEEQLTAIMETQRISGVYIWQFADVPVAEECAMGRPLTRNNKGVVDMFRNPKMSYFTVKRLFGSSKRG